DATTKSQASSCPRTVSRFDALQGAPCGPNSSGFAPRRSQQLTSTYPPHSSSPRSERRRSVRNPVMPSSSASVAVLGLIPITSAFRPASDHVRESQCRYGEGPRGFASPRTPGLRGLREPLPVGSGPASGRVPILLGLLGGGAGGVLGQVLAADHDQVQ